MKRPSQANRKLFALALLAGAGGACSNVAEEDASDATGQEQYAQQIQAELDAASVADASTFNSVKSVRPSLKCVDKLANNQYRAHFGYSNSASSSVSIPVGFYNRFWPPPIGRGQPTAFAPGSQSDVVQVTFSGFSASIWVLGNHFAIATKFTKLCPAAGGTGGVTGTGGVGTGGMGTGGRGTGGMGTGGAVIGTGGMGTGGRGTGGMGTGGVVIGTGGMGTGGVGTGGMGTGGMVIGTGGMGTGGAGTGGMGTGGMGTGGTVTGTGGMCVPPTNCDDQNPCTTDRVDTVACICVHVAGIDGTTCNDGNACTLIDSCVQGVCVGGSPKTCVALDTCHVAGVCAPATGVCSNPNAPDGKTCSDGNACTTSDICVGGLCTMGAPVLCNAPDACHTPGTCNPTTGACSNPSAPNGTVCSDNSACTTGDSCQAGACTGAPVVCTASDQCHVVGACNPANGTCSNPIATNGLVCNDNNACTNSDTCQNGSCAGAPVVCTASGVCHVAGTCNTTTGICSNPNAANGTACSDSNACTSADSCQNGACTGSAVVCPAPTDPCKVAGICDAASGQCGTINAPNGTTCTDNNACTVGDACQAGACVPGAPSTAPECPQPRNIDCEQCSFGPAAGEANVCDSNPGGCFNCVPDTDGCQGLADPNDRVLCQNLYACIIKPTHPGTSVPGACDPLRCWCGTNPTTCVTSNADPTKANGPCLAEIQAAAKLSTYDAAFINQHLIDPNLPIGRAINIANCQGSFCIPECKIPF